LLPLPKTFNLSCIVTKVNYFEIWKQEIGSLLYVSESHTTFLHESGTEKTRMYESCEKWNYYKNGVPLYPL